MNKEQFLGHSDLKRMEVEIDGLGAITMRELSVGESIDARRKHAALLDGVPEGERDTVLSLALIATSLCNGVGPMFAEPEIADATKSLLARSQRTIMRLQSAFVRLNGLGEGALETAVGNSTEIPSERSSSGSPVISDTPASRGSRRSSRPKTSGTGKRST